MSALTVRNLSVSIGGSLVVDGVSFTVEPGECFAIIGESGSGKTMTATALLGLTPSAARVTADELTIAGADARDLAERQWRAIRGARVGLVSQDALVALDPLRRVGREVAEAIEVHEPEVDRTELSRRVIRLLERVAVPRPELRAAQYPRELSGGLRQRALIASAIAAGPPLLVADEPTTALDTTVQAQVLELLAALKASGSAIVLVSHDLGVVARLADRIAVMWGGRFVEVGEAGAVLGAPQHPYTRELLAAQPTERTASRPGGEVVLEVKALSKVFGRAGGERTVAVDEVAFELRGGRTIGIVGESGSGKSTLARMLVGIERPDAGEVLLNAGAWSTLTPRRKRALRGAIQLIDQDPFGSFDPRFTVRRILGEAVALSPTPRAERLARVRELLGQVGLGDELLGRRAHQLSGGQRQRVAIARALARRPQIVVCDEPVSALDVSVQAGILALLGGLQQELGLSLVFISHDLAVIGQMSDEILVMKDGVVVERGDAATVLGEPRHPFTRALIAAAQLPI